jgi:hypothetical protein
MPAIEVDLLSDTVTRPTRAMRQFMCEAEVGDEQTFEDPTVNTLQEMVAELLGKEAALFLPSGTMCNEIALRVHCRPGDEMIAHRTAHPIHFEAGGPAALAGVNVNALDGARGQPPSLGGADQQSGRRLNAVWRVASPPASTRRLLTRRGSTSPKGSAPRLAQRLPVPVSSSPRPGASSTHWALRKYFDTVCRNGFEAGGAGTLPCRI